MTTWLTTGQAADLFGVTKNTVKDWANQGLLRYKRTAGGHYRIAEQEAQEFDLMLRDVNYQKDRNCRLAGKKRFSIIKANTARAFGVSGFGE